MKRYVTSDLHFSHRNIISFCPWSRGQFSTIEEMNAKIVENINSVVTDNDELYILGDIGFGDLNVAIECLKQMNGKKFIISGNHDKKLLKLDAFITQRGLMNVLEVTPYLELTHRNNGKASNVCMFHFPIESWNGAHHGSYHLHGHKHSAPDQVIDRRRMDIGLDSNNLMPYLLDDVLERLSHQPTHREHHE